MMDSVSRSDEWSEKTNQLYDELNSKINEFMHSIFEDSELAEHGDYVDGWVLVLNYGNVNYDQLSAGYLVEAFPHKMPPHAIKGLLREGIDWIVEAQNEMPEVD